MFKLIVDNFCEAKEFTKKWQTDIFWDFSKHEVVSGAVYLFSRQQFNQHIKKIKQLAQEGTILPILGNPAEGSATMLQQILHLDILELVKQDKILIIAGGDLPKDIPFLYIENFLPKLMDYQENLQAMQDYKDHWTTERPYKFLFLNGRGRKHRQFLLRTLEPILDQSIWTNLDSSAGPINLLDPKYEHESYKNFVNLPDSGFIKAQLFKNEWGEIYLNHRAYNDSYFSLVTETVFDYPYSFRTEKIWKPIAIGHPFIVASNWGYYRDLHKLGFKTFGHLIDESFDLIENNQQRSKQIASVVKDLCQQDLSAFIQAADEVCKYNQLHMAELRPIIRKEFPQRFINFINERS